ncbi:PPK2 family polyphosphate kinase [Homoserinimonas sp. OAct 916]|uniref:PPK2 family polyphosphate kinase n=1 Tax=Homoserinimonas sp. OAct 916 TaxID=2211450 RepID=UPI001E478A26|nr:PPK2 family polyphosphate kinase [Homoserinimonas sp. OAct 916]
MLRVREGFVLSEVDPDATPGFSAGKVAGQEALAAGVKPLAELQERLYAESRTGQNRSVLLVLQAMDSAGKGGILRHVVGRVDPQGVQATAFKKPTPEELQHDFLWRVEKALPDAGMIGVFDRSHYEDVLIGRVRQLAAPEEIERRYGAIKDFEEDVVASETTIIKVMLHISSGEQKSRLTERVERVDKYWKYNPADVDERMLWPAYQDAFQVALTRTSTADAPWFVVPANHKWYARLAVQALLIDALDELDPRWPAPHFDVDVERARLAAS